jgi:hypothetical protein
MRVSAPLVVAGWGAANGLLTALLAGMGGTGTPSGVTPVGIYAGAVVIVEAIAVAVLASRRRRGAAPIPDEAPGGATMLFLAIGVLLFGLGLAFGWWVTMLSAGAFAAAAATEVYAARKQPHPG